MKIKVRNLRNEGAEIEIKPTETVRQLKEAVQQQLGAPPADNQRLIHRGAVLEDSKTIADYPALKDNEQIIVMGAKNIPSRANSKKVQEQIASPATAKVPSDMSTTQNPTLAQPVSARQPPAVPEPVIGSEPADGSEPVAGGQPLGVPGFAGMTEEEREARESAISALVGMGFARPAVETAIVAAMGDSVAAVQYMTEGIPGDMLSDIIGQSQPGGRGPLEGPDAHGHANVSGVAGVGEDNPFYYLRNHPSYEPIRAAILSDPSNFAEVIEAIRQSNPELIDLVHRHPQAFLRALDLPLDHGSTLLHSQNLEQTQNAPQPQDTQNPTSLAHGLAESAAQSEEPVADTGATPHSARIEISPLEAEALVRLEALGFPRHLVLEAFLTCERNEQMAANYLCEYLMDQQEPQNTGHQQ